MENNIYGAISPIYEKNKAGVIQLYGFKGRKGIGRNPVTGKYKQEIFYGRTIEEVKEKMNAFMTNPIDEINKKGCELLVSDWTKYWLENVKLPMVKESSKSMYRRQIDIVNKAIGGRNIKNTSRLILQSVINDRAKSGKNTSSLCIVMKQCFKDAFECSYIDSNIAKGLRYKNNPIKVKIPLSKDEDLKMAAYIKGNPLENLIIFLRGSACRVSEACGLSWDQVHLEEGYVLISQQLDGREVSFSTKNNLFAPVYMPDYVFEALRKEKEKQESQGLRNPNNLVFLTSQGKPYTPKKVNEYIKEIGEAIDRPELTAHYFRHTRASEVYAQTHDPLIVQKLLRHKTLRTTLQYLHTIGGYSVSAEKAMQADHERVFGQKLK